MGFFSIAAATSTPGAYYAFQVSDTLGKLIVVILLGASVVAWTLMLDKWLALHKAKKMSEAFIAAFNQNKRRLDALALQGANDPSPIAVIYTGGVEKLQEFYRQQCDANSTLSTAGAKLTVEQTNAIEAVLEREISVEIMELESGVGVLATLVSVCPFIGLFGTVWGVMIAFVGMAQQGSADIGAMAPGIASALLTTVVGLVVAIPSVVGYNLILSTIKCLIVHMDNFSEAFMVRLKLEQIERENKIQ